MTNTNDQLLAVLASPGGAGGMSGGGGGSSAPSNSLSSISYASFLDLLCEGEIQGLVNGVQSIFLDGVPLQEGNGTNNFVGTTVGWVNGTQAQPYIPGFASVQATATVNTEVYNSVPVTSQIDNPEATSVIITLAVAGLSSTSASSGDVSGTSVQMTVSYQPTNSAYIQALDVTFNGYTDTEYQQSYQFALTGTGPWTVMVERITPDSDNDDLVNPTYVAAVTSVVDTKLSYPNSALVGFQIDARQFSAIPERAYLIQGLLIQVPNNYNPLDNTYTGIWDGGFQLAYSNNPAWCLNDLLTSDRYGLGLYINTADIDTTSLYEIGQYCDEMVPDGFGGQEPRFSLNTCITTAKGAYDLVQDLCSAFRGMTYWGAGTILTTQDAPWQGPMPLFSPANVLNGQFTYSGSMRKDRHTVAYVTYNEPAQQYMQATEYVENPAGITRYGVRAVNIMAVGCTSRGQAYRLGMWQLLSEQYDTDQLQFSAGMDAAQLTPGTIIQIADPVRAGERMGGRIVAGTTTGIVLDAPVTLDAGQTYTLYYMDSTGAQQTVGVVNTAETTNELQFTTTAPTAPNPSFMWGLSGSNLNTQLFRVINVQESARNQFDVLAVTYNESKFDAIDFDTVLQIPPISLTLSLVALQPSLWSITPTSYLIAPGVIGQKLLMSWSGNSAQYLFQWRVNGGPWQSTTLTTPSNVITGVTAGDVYDFQVYGLSSTNQDSQPLIETFTVPVLGTPPNAPTDLTATPSLLSVVLNWAAPTNLDLDYFQVFMATVNNLENAVLVASNVGSTTWTVDALVSGDTYYFWVNAVNTSGIVGPYNSDIGTAATVLYVQPGNFDINTILYDIANSQEITGAMIADETITSQNIAAQAVATANIQNAAVATAQIQDGAVTATQIANASITTACIADAAITTALIANAAITTALIANAAIGTAQIEYEAVTSALIANEAAGTSQIQQAAITYAQIATAAVGTLSIQGGAVSTTAAYSGTNIAPSYVSSDGQMLVFFNILDEVGVNGGIQLQIDGAQVFISYGIGIGFWQGTLSSGSHTLQVLSYSSNDGNWSADVPVNIGVFEIKR
jgi:predicted phage tail protein